MDCSIQREKKRTNVWMIPKRSAVSSPPPEPRDFFKQNQQKKKEKSRSNVYRIRTRAKMSNISIEEKNTMKDRHFVSKRYAFVVWWLVILFLMGASATMASTTNTTDPHRNETVAIHGIDAVKNDKERALERWGHVELLGSGKEYEFVKALFGAPLRCNAQTLQLADPLDLCAHSRSDDVRGKILYSKRGGCTFSDKAWFAQQAGAAGLIIGNTDQSILRMPEGYHAVEETNPVIEIPVVMVRRSAGDAIEKIAKRRKGMISSVAIVSKKWTSQGTFLHGPCARGYRNVPDATETTKEVSSSAEDTTTIRATYRLTASDVEMLSSDGGRLALVADEKSRSFEFLRGNFGGPPPGGPVRLLLADPLDGCSAATQTRRVRKNAKETIMVMRRGECAFSVKAKTAEELGASSFVLINNEDQALVIMSDGYLDEDEITIFPIMITYESGEQLIDILSEGSKVYAKISMSPFSIGPLWSNLEDVSHEPAESWGTTSEKRKETFDRLLRSHDPSVLNGTGSVERLAYVTRIFESLPPIPIHNGEL